MDLTDILTTSGISTSIIVLVGLVYKILHHCSIRSKCCDKEGSVNIDLSPKPDSFLVNPPA